MVLKAIEATKWAGTGALIAATSIRSMNLSHTLDIVLSLVGVALWLVVGIKLRDKPLAIVNAFSVVILTAGVFHLFS